MTIQVIRGDARQLPLPNSSVDLVITSPPYFALRSYTDGGEHYDGQIGAEPTPAEFVKALLECTREMARVLKPSGSLWLNLGDKYSSGTSGDRNSGFNIRYGNAPGRQKQERSQVAAKRVSGMPPKSLLGIPWRYALACIDDLGLILRAEVIWSKPNGLPESVTDRVRRSHEQWFHFTVQPRYYSAVDEIREPHTYPDDTRHLRGGRRSINSDGSPGGGNTSNGNPLGKLPGSVWSIPTEPLRVPPELGVDHFAAFPSEFPRRIVLGWSPREVCTVCGEGRRPVTDRAKAPDRPGRVQLRDVDAMTDAHGPDGRAGSRHTTQATITGYSCACPDTTAPATPSVVLDPFGGTGTTAHVASALGRTGISLDLSADYCRLAAHPHLAEKRAAKVLGTKPVKKKTASTAPTGPTLFDLGGAA